MANKFFKGKLKYTTENDEGHLVVAVHEFILDSVSFTEAEKRLYEWAEQNVRGEFTVESLNKTNITDLVVTDNAGPFWAVKIQYAATDEISGREKKVTNNMIFEGQHPEDIIEAVRELLKNMLVGFDITSLVVTKVEEIIEREEKEDEEDEDEDEEKDEDLKN